MKGTRWLESREGSSEAIRVVSLRQDLSVLAGALALLGGVIGLYFWVLQVSHPLIVGFTLLLVVLPAAATARLWVPLTVSIVAMLAFNFFFLAPVGTLYLTDPQNWVALCVFVTVSLVAGNLSASARRRAREAVARERELARERSAAEVARRSEELKSTLLASISHDLRSPLTAIRVAASNLQASWLEEGDRREQSDVIVAEVERLQRLFQNILEMARIDAGAVAPIVQWVHPSEIVEAARDLAQPALRGHRLDIHSSSESIVQVDPRLTASALGHVLENAAQYSPSGTTIALDIDVSSAGLTMLVRDRGPGIAPADVPHLFERFYRGAAANQQTSGTGMGLAIAKGLLAAEKGTIAVKNGAEGGAEFTIAVPAPSRVAAEAGAEP